MRHSLECHHLTASSTDVLLERARAWAAEDPDDVTRAELEQIIAEVEAGGDPTDLADRFAGTLEFGTAGLRGAVGAGPNRMNRVVVIRAAAGWRRTCREHGRTRDGTPSWSGTTPGTTPTSSPATPPR